MLLLRPSSNPQLSGQSAPGVVRFSSSHGRQLTLWLHHRFLRQPSVVVCCCRKHLASSCAAQCFGCAPTPRCACLPAVSDAGRCERVRANLGTTRARGEVDMEITLRKMQHKEDKMQRTASQFQEMEQTVYNSLFTLIKDTSVLRDYAAAALLIINVSRAAGWVCCAARLFSCLLVCAAIGSDRGPR